MPRPDMREQRSGRGYRQPVGGIRGGRHAQLGKNRRVLRRRGPHRPVIHDLRRLSHDIGRPANLRRIELPHDAGKGGNLADLAQPDPGRPGADDMAGAQRGRGRRDRDGPAGDRHLDDQIKDLQRLIMGHVFLCLRGLDQGQRLNVRCIGHGYLRGNALTPKTR